MAIPATSVNNMNLYQLAEVLNTIQKGVTGVDNIQPITNASEFISVAQTVLKAGYDPLMQSISQVLSRTIFSIRPYSSKFRRLEADSIRFGNHVRKVSVSDSDWEEDQRQLLVDGQSVDMFKVRKPKVLQTNFYGENVFQRHYTVFRDQLDVAFSSAEEFGRFLSMITQNNADLVEQARENTSRMIIQNLVGGVYAIGNTDQVIHMVTEYNSFSGENLTAETVMNPDNFPAFVRWAFAFIETLCERMTERTIAFQQNVDEKPISRHTPRNKQEVYLFGPMLNLITTLVRTTTFNESFLKFPGFEKVSYWQNFKDPEQISITPVYMKKDGTLDNDVAVSIPYLMGTIFDVEAAGFTSVNEWTATTPLNAAGGYWNIFHHFTQRYWNDFTEKAVILLLD